MLILVTIRRYIENAVPELWTRQGVIDDESGKNQLLSVTCVAEPL